MGDDGRLLLGGFGGRLGLDVLEVAGDVGDVEQENLSCRLVYVSALALLVITYVHW